MIPEAGTRAWSILLFLLRVLRGFRKNLIND